MARGRIQFFCGWRTTGWIMVGVLFSGSVTSFAENATAVETSFAKAIAVEGRLIFGSFCVTESVFSFVAGPSISGVFSVACELAAKSCGSTGGFVLLAGAAGVGGVGGITGTSPCSGASGGMGGIS